MRALILAGVLALVCGPAAALSLPDWLGLGGQAEEPAAPPRPVVSVIVDEDDNVLPDAWVELMGLSTRTRSGGDLVRQIEAELSEFLERADARTVRDDGKMDEAIRKITRQVAMEEIGKKPEVTVSISRLMAD